MQNPNVVIVSIPMGFQEKIRETLGSKFPENPRLSAVTKRIILSQREYSDLQDSFVHGDYNMWCTGMNKHLNPDNDPNLPYFNYIETGDAKNFSDLFIPESKATLEAKEADASEEGTPRANT